MGSQGQLLFALSLQVSVYFLCISCFTSLGETFNVYIFLHTAVQVSKL